MTTLPSSDDITYVAGEPGGTWTDAVKQLYSFVKEGIAVAAATALTIGSGAITPTQAAHAVDTEGAAAADDLTNIATTNIADGRWIVLRPVSTSRVVTVKHRAGGAGQIALLDGQDHALGTDASFLILERDGDGWREILRDLPFSSQAEAEAGAAAGRVMNPLRTAQAIAAQVRAFRTLVVSGQSDVVAEQLGDTLTLVAGANVEIATDPTTDTITFSATGGVSSADFAVQQQQILELYLMQAIYGDLASGGFINGAFDPFRTNTISGTSTGQTYDAGNKLYWNPSVPSTSYANAGGTGNRTGSITASFIGSWYGVSSAPNTIDGTTGTQNSAMVASGTAVSGLAIRYFFGSGAAKYFTEFKAYYNSTPSVVTEGQWKWQGSNNGTVWSDITAPFSWGQTATATYTATGNYGPWDYVQLVGVSGSSTQSCWLSEVEFKIGTSAGGVSMTLVSSALSTAPSVAPTSIRGMVLINSAGTVNTDYILSASRNGGANWTAGTLISTGAVLTKGGVDFTLYTADINVSGQTSGTDPRLKLATTATTVKVGGWAEVYK